MERLQILLLYGQKLKMVLCVGLLLRKGQRVSVLLK